MSHQIGKQITNIEKVKRMLSKKYGEQVPTIASRLGMSEENVRSVIGTLRAKGEPIESVGKYRFVLVHKRSTKSH